MLGAREGGYNNSVDIIADEGRRKAISSAMADDGSGGEWEIESTAPQCPFVTLTTKVCGKTAVVSDIDGLHEIAYGRRGVVI